MKFGAVLKASRQRRGLSQEELAYELNINQSDVSKYETDIKEPTMNLFRDWATTTQAQDVLVAFITGFDGLSILEMIMDLGGNVASLIFF